MFCKRSAEKADRASNFVSLLGALGSLAICWRRAGWRCSRPLPRSDAHDRIRRGPRTLTEVSLKAGAAIKFDGGPAAPIGLLSLEARTAIKFDGGLAAPVPLFRGIDHALFRGISGRGASWGSRGPFSQGDAHDALVFV